MKRLIDLVQFFRIFPPIHGQNLIAFHKFLRKKNAFTKTNDRHEYFDTLKADLTRATELTLQSAKPSLHYVILCDASFHGTGFVLMIEEHLIDQNVKQRQTTLQSLNIKSF